MKHLLTTSALAILLSIPHTGQASSFIEYAQIAQAEGTVSGAPTGQRPSEGDAYPENVKDFRGGIQDNIQERRENRQENRAERRDNVQDKTKERFSGGKYRNNQSKEKLLKRRNTRNTNARSKRRSGSGRR